MNKSLQAVLKDIRATNQLGSANAASESKTNPWKSREVPFTAEFERIYALPRRNWEDAHEGLEQKLSKLLKTEDGEQELRPIQAVSLYELWALGFLFCNARVGGGKTLVLFLAAYVLRAIRPILFVPANLLDKTERDLKRYSKHWKIPNFIRLETYEKLQHMNHTDLLSKYKPDLLLFDEAQKLKNPSSSRIDQLRYYKEDCIEEPKPGFPNKLYWVFASGTFTDQSLKDYRHLFELAMPEDRIPLPNVFSEFMQWCLALDEDVGELSRLKIGALVHFCGKEERKLLKQGETLKAARRGYRKRLITTPGFISTSKTYMGTSLRIQSVETEVPKNVVKAFWMLRKRNTSPSGEELQDGHAIAAQAKMISTGMYLEWDPKPPKKWVQAQTEWRQKCRRTLRYTRRRISTEGQLVKAIEEYGLYPKIKPALDNWKFWKKQFIPESKAIWISDYAINYAAEWMEKNPGIVWVYHPAFGKRLSEVTGIPFYWNRGLDAKGRFIEDHPHKRPMIAGIQPNMEGKNLQHGWNLNLLMHAPRRSSWWEQILGRTHRDEQKEDEVCADLFTVCREQVDAYWHACLRAEYVLDTLDPPPKLLIANNTMIPTLHEISMRKGLLWEFDPGCLEDEREDFDEAA